MRGKQAPTMLPQGALRVNRPLPGSTGELAGSTEERGRLNGADLDLDAGLVQSLQCVFRTPAIAIDERVRDPSRLINES